MNDLRQKDAECIGENRQKIAGASRPVPFRQMKAEKHHVSRDRVGEHLAPVKIAVLPLSKKLNEGAEKVFDMLLNKYYCEFDDRGSIGKRYRRQDEIGTPFCITYDFDSEQDGSVTIRHRDSMEQERIKIDELLSYFDGKFDF